MGKSGGASRTSRTVVKTVAERRGRKPGELSKAAWARIERHGRLRDSAMANAAEARFNGDEAAAARFQERAREHLAAIKAEHARAMPSSAPRSAPAKSKSPASQSKPRQTKGAPSKASLDARIQTARAEYQQRSNEAEDEWRKATAAGNDPTDGRRFVSWSAARDRALAAESQLRHLEEERNRQLMRPQALAFAKSKPYETHKLHGPVPVREHYGVTTTITLRRPEFPANLRDVNEHTPEGQRLLTILRSNQRAQEHLSSQKAYERIVSRVNSRFDAMERAQREAASRNVRSPQQQREDTARNSLRVRTLAGRVHDAEIDHQHAVLAVRATEPGTKAYDAARTRAKAVYAKQESLRAEMNRAYQDELAKLNAATGAKPARAPRAKKAG